MEGPVGLAVHKRWLQRPVGKALPCEMHSDGNVDRARTLAVPTDASAFESASLEWALSTQTKCISERHVMRVFCRVIAACQRFNTGPRRYNQLTQRMNEARTAKVTLLTEQSICKAMLATQLQWTKHTCMYEQRQHLYAIFNQHKWQEHEVQAEQADFLCFASCHVHHGLR